jgi:hypothetical protein
MGDFSRDGKAYLLEPLSSAVGLKLPRLSIIRYKPKFSISWTEERSPTSSTRIGKSVGP